MRNKLCPKCNDEEIPVHHQLCRYCIARSREGGVYEPSEQEIYAKAAELRAARRHGSREDDAVPVELKEVSVVITDKIKLGTARMYNGRW